MQTSVQHEMEQRRHAKEKRAQADQEKSKADAHQRYNEQADGTFSSQREQLKHRVEEKKKRLEAKIAELHADSIESIRLEKKRLKESLAYSQSLLKDGWEKISEETAAKLNQWIERDNH